MVEKTNVFKDETNFYHKMNNNNLFLSFYQQKSDEELNTLALDANYAEDARLCAIQILKERNVSSEELSRIENELIENRESRPGNIASDRYSTGFARFVALIIDGFIFSIIGWTLKIFDDSESALILALIGFVDVVVPYVYNIVLHGSCGQTFGKMIMNIKVFDKSEKKSISFKQALFRDIVPLSLIMVLQLLTFFTDGDNRGFLTYVSLIMASIVLLWSLLEIITMLFDPKRRALHDYIAGTVVLNVKS